jgi:hypothetical protein
VARTVRGEGIHPGTQGRSENLFTTGLQEVCFFFLLLGRKLKTLGQTISLSLKESRKEIGVEVGFVGVNSCNGFNSREWFRCSLSSLRNSETKQGRGTLVL